MSVSNKNISKEVKQKKAEMIKTGPTIKNASGTIAESAVDVQNQISNVPAVKTNESSLTSMAVPGTSSDLPSSATSADENAFTFPSSSSASVAGGRQEKARIKAKKEVTSSSPLAQSEQTSSTTVVTSRPTKQEPKPIVHCLFCQNKMELHPSLVTGGGEIAPIGRDSPEEHKINEHDESDVPTTASSSKMFLSQSDGNWNLLELIGKSQSPLDIPMCKKCANSIAGELQKQLVQLEQECQQYKQSLDELLKRRNQSPFEQDARKLEELKMLECDLKEQLAFLEDEERALNSQLEAKMEERVKISQQDETLYRKLRDNHRSLIDQAEEQRSLKQQIRHTDEQIKRLKGTNVLDMCFHIWVDGEFGTISGFRLGRLRHEQVEWNEINAAFGQMIFLLKVIATKLNMTFTGYELVPCGNASFIRVTKPQSLSNGTRNEELPFFGSGGWRPFGQPALDKGLIAFMDCFLQVEQRLKQYFPAGTQLLPYRMLKDKIIDKDSQYLVKMQLNSEERWTKAMKCLLLNLKQALAILIAMPALTAEQISPRPSTVTGGDKNEATKNGSSNPSLGTTSNK